MDAAHGRGHQGLLRHHHQSHRGRDRSRGRARTRYRNKADVPVCRRRRQRVRRPRLRRHATRSRRSTCDSFPYTPDLPDTGRRDRQEPGLAERPDATTTTAATPASAARTREYGDFFGLDDLFTEHPEVVDGMIDIYRSGSTSSASTASASTPSSTSTSSSGRLRPRRSRLTRQASGKPTTSSCSARSSTRDPAFMSQLHDRGQASGDARLRLPGSGARASPRARARPTACATSSRPTTTTPTPTSNAYSAADVPRQPRHGPHRPRSSRRPTRARRRRAAGPRPAGPRAACTSRAACPVVYYGDEQGFTGDGGDKDAREDMIADARSPRYNDDDLIGTDATTADANFDRRTRCTSASAISAALTRRSHGAARRRPDPAATRRATAGHLRLLAGSTRDERDRVRGRAQQRASRRRPPTIPTYSPTLASPRCGPAGGAPTDDRRQRRDHGHACRRCRPWSTGPTQPLARLARRAEHRDRPRRAAGSEVGGRVEVGADVADAGVRGGHVRGQGR